MTRDELHQLANVRIASPCPVRWADMQGDEKRRFCAQCQLHVHRLSELRRDEVMELLEASRTERVCVQLFYRLDGTVMTKDCASAWSVGVSEAVRYLAPVVGVGSAVGGAAVFMLAVVLALVTFFGDNIRMLFGDSTGGALAGASTTVTKRTKHKKPVVAPVAPSGTSNGT